MLPILTKYFNIKYYLFFIDIGRNQDYFKIWIELSKSKKDLINECAKYTL